MYVCVCWSFYYAWFSRVLNWYKSCPFEARDNVVSRQTVCLTWRIRVVSQINFNTSENPLLNFRTIAFVVKKTETRKLSLIFEYLPDLRLWSKEESVLHVGYKRDICWCRELFLNISIDWCSSFNWILKQICCLLEMKFYSKLIKFNEH